MIKTAGKRDQEPFLRRWGWLCLSATALFYYAFYWRSGLMLSGEDGVAAVVAQRLNGGQRPIIDTFLGYNIGWFYPIAWIFRIFGPGYLLLRAYFFLLALASGLTAYLMIRRITREERWAMLGGLCVILMPGVIGRNYMGFLGILGILSITGLFVLTPDNRLHRAIAISLAGISISLSWLVRIDLGFFQTLLFLLAAFLYLLRPATGSRHRFVNVLVATTALVLIFGVTQGFAYRHAVTRGFGRDFSDQYFAWPLMIRNEALQLVSRLSKPVFKPDATVRPATQTSTSPSPDDSDQPASYSAESLKRPPLSSILKAPKLKERFFALVIYLPGIVSIILAAWGLLLVIKSLVIRDETVWKRGGCLLVATGGSLVLFPQYFFWRPDMIHLAEFMVPFMATLVLAIFVSYSELTAGRSSRFFMIMAVIVLVMSGLNLSCYLIKGWQTDGTGSIASSRRRHLEFTALNGVRVKLNASELARCTLIRDAIAAHSSPGEFIVCYPYYPMVNFMTDRPSYEYNLYADNSLPPEKFHRLAILHMEQHHPAVIVIGTGRINATEASRFPVWASRTYEHIRKNFALVASDPDAEIEIYAARP